MALESVTHISDLNASNPVGATDPKSEGDDHIRNIKTALLTDFPAITGPVTATQTELNLLDGVTATTAELNILDGVTADATELNLLDGVTATTAELNYLDIATLGTGAASKAVVLDAGDDYTWPATGILTYGVLNDGTTTLTATAAEINTACDGITATATEINTVCDGVLTGSVTWDPASILDGASETKQLTVTGAAIGDFVIAAPGVDVQGFTFSGSVIATDTVELVLSNNTGGAIDIASSTWKVKVLK